jgi:hypothetical protein
MEEAPPSESKSHSALEETPLPLWSPSVISLFTRLNTCPYPKPNESTAHSRAPLPYGVLARYPTPSSTNPVDLHRSHISHYFLNFSKQQQMYNVKGAPQIFQKI